MADGGGVKTRARTILFPDTVTIGDKYRGAMTITDQSEADAYFEVCVEHTMRFGKTRAEAEDIERQNLGYYAGYYGNDVREHVERLFQCAHPVFGKIAEHGAPTEAEALEAGFRMGRQLKAGGRSNG